MISTMYYSSWINESVNASLRSNGGIFLKLYKKLDSVEYVREKWIFFSKLLNTIELFIHKFTKFGYLSTETRNIGG